MSNALLDQQIREALVQDTANACVDGQYREALVQDTANVRIDGLYREMWVSLDVIAVNGLYREMWVPVTGGGDLGRCQPPDSYYLFLITSQYQQSPKYLAWLTAVLEIICDINACVRSVNDNFDIDKAVGVQLDILGQIIGASRTVPFQPTGNANIQALSLAAAGTFYFTGDILTLDQPGATNGKVRVDNNGPSGNILAFSLVFPGDNYSVASNVPVTGGHGSGAQFNILSVSDRVSPVLDDDTYRLLLKAKIAQNQWDGQLASLYAIWQQLFPGGIIAVQDNQNMTATIFLSGITSSIIQDMVVNGLIVPRPEGVLYNYVLSDLPAFGFDGDHVFIAGFDEGHWA